MARPGELSVSRSRFLLLTAAISASACGRQPAQAPAQAQSGFDTTHGAPEPAAVVIPTATPEASEAPASSARGNVQHGCSDRASGPLPSCSRLEMPGPGCEQGMTFTQDECAVIPKVLEARAAEKLMTCLVEQSHKELCSLNTAMFTCPGKTLENACRDPSVTDACKPVVSKCARKHYSLAECERLLSAVKPEYRREAISCAVESCSDACLIQLVWSVAN